MNCQALESMDVDCTEVHNAIKDVQDAADRLHRVTIEKQLVFFTTQEASISEHLKDYIHGLRLFLGKPADNELAKEPIEKLLRIDENGDSVITHAVSSGSVSSLEFLLNQPSCVDALLNLPSWSAARLGPAPVEWVGCPNEWVGGYGVIHTYLHTCIHTYVYIHTLNGWVGME